MREKIVNVTDEEKTWLRELASGKKADVIAEEMGMRPGTLSYKLNILRSKLGCKNMAELMAYSIRHKIIE